MIRSWSFTTPEPVMSTTLEVSWQSSSVSSSLSWTIPWPGSLRMITTSFGLYSLSTWTVGWRTTLMTHCRAASRSRESNPETCKPRRSRPEVMSPLASMAGLEARPRFCERASTRSASQVSKLHKEFLIARPTTKVVAKHFPRDSCTAHAVI